MTCQHCQTWILDDDHRCPRCGRRVRTTPPRISPATYPIAATATAPSYDFIEDPALQQPPEPPIRPRLRDTPRPGQQQLFPNAGEPRVIPFDLLTSPEERESIRARAADLSRPAPIKSEKVQVKRARTQKHNSHQDQRRLDFLNHFETVVQPQTSIICDAPVAPPALRFRAALLDGLIMLLGCAAWVAIFRYAGGSVLMNRHELPFFLIALSTVPFVYKLVWTLAGQDTPGMQKLGLQLVDFDGNPPSRTRRYQRLAGSMISLLAAGMGMIWAFVDEDNLAWHDHMSSTFPTVLSD